MNVLVTGGAGYIGSHTCLALYEAGFTPITYDNLSRGHKHHVQFGPLEVGDIRDKERLSSVINKYKPITIIHLAALAYVGESMNEPSIYYDNNVNGTLTLLNVMLEEKINNIIFSSTCAVYGNPNNLPVTEKSPIKPVSPYGRTKFMIEQAINDFSCTYGIKYIILRYFNAAGGDSKGHIGENHEPEPHIIPRVIKTALGKIEYFNINGEDYPTPDGTCIRDYIHVSDIAKAHILSFNKLLSGECGNKIINLGGGGRGFSVLEIVKKIEMQLGPIKTKSANRRSGDAVQLYSDITKAKKLLGWSPEKSSLDNIIRTAIKWEKKQA